MYTQLDKAISAFIVAALGLIGVIFHKEINVDPAAIGAVVSLIVPLVVYFIPNKTPQQPIKPAVTNPGTS